ncbi:hypothetical protein [Gillisia sp. CAL575]|uniref:hypothetical protein n=1 Tax=Gillisia sp. CAL575 TaxID=985255 RepID=UPI0003A37E27|nr:hypothetical protein [Gillisia sp. CAL575]
MIIKKIFFFLIVFYVNQSYSQEYREVNYKGIEGVILCEEYFSKKYRKTYKIYNLSPEEIYEFEKFLEETENRYLSYNRKYQGIIKDGKKHINSKLINRIYIDQYSPNWKQDKTLYIHECNTRTIVYSFSEKKIIMNKFNECGE